MWININCIYAQGWGSSGALWSVPEMSGSNSNGCIKVEEVQGEDWKIGRREASVLRYREKRQNRLFSKKIRYEVRKLNAEKRPRIKVIIFPITYISSSKLSTSIYNYMSIFITSAGAICEKDLRNRKLRYGYREYVLCVVVVLFCEIVESAIWWISRNGCVVYPEK